MSKVDRTVSLAVAGEILKARPERHLRRQYKAYMKQLKVACREVRTVDILGGKLSDPRLYLLICGDVKGHKNQHEDVDGGIWWGSGK